MILSSIYPILTDIINCSSADNFNLIYPTRILSKVINLSTIDPKKIKELRRTSLMMSSLNEASGGCSIASIQDCIFHQDNSYLFANNRRLLPIGYSLGLLTNNVDLIGINIVEWIPGGQLIDVLIGRVEYSELSVMLWAQQILMAFRWLHNAFAFKPHGNLCPKNILAARRTSALPDIVITGLGHSPDLHDDHLFTGMYMLAIKTFFIYLNFSPKYLIIII